MANYDFGQQILRSIEIQDQLKQRNDELKMQQMHWNAQLGMQQRQMELEQARLNEMANYHGAQLNLNQDKFMQTARENFLKSHTPAESLPSDIRSKLSPKDAVVSPFDNKPYYLTSTVTDTEQSLTRAETAKRDAQMAKHQGILESQGATRLNIESQMANIAAEKLKRTSPKSGGIISPKDKSSLIGDISQQLSQYDLAKGYSGEVPITDSKGKAVSGNALKQTYANWKSGITGNIDNLLSGVGLGTTKNSPALTNLMSYVTPDAIKSYEEQYKLTPIEAKRQIINDAIYLYSSKNKLNQDQIDALKLWKEEVTR